jgi:carbonic anhydrase
VGHSKCGGVTAALVAAQNNSDPSITITEHPASSPLNLWLAPLTKFALQLKSQFSSKSQDDALQFLVEQNVRTQVDNIAKSEVMKETWKHEIEGSGRAVRVHGWVYDLGTGLLKDLDTTRGPSGSH